MNLKKTIEGEYANLADAEIHTIKKEKSYVSEICEAFEYVLHVETPRFKMIEKINNVTFDQLHLKTSMQYSSEDITAFSTCLDQFSNKYPFLDKEHFEVRSGIFLTRLILLHHAISPKETEYVLITKGYGEKCAFVGLQSHTVDIRIIGDIGRYAFAEAYSGKMTVEGSVGKSCGKKMIDGELIIKENAGPYAGEEMSGGTISIQKNAGAYLGMKMSGGNISVEETIAGLPDTLFLHGGEIYNKGRRVFPK